MLSIRVSSLHTVQSPSSDSKRHAMSKHVHPHSQPLDSTPAPQQASAPQQLRRSLRSDEVAASAAV